MVALSEALETELRLVGARVRVSVLCPGMVHTDLDRSIDSRGDLAAQAAARARAGLGAGMAPDEVADRMVAAIREDRFYILTHPPDPARLRWRTEAVLDGRSPTP